MFRAADWTISPVSGRLLLLQDDLFSRKKVSVRVWEENQGPPELRGNKWHKLKFNLQEASRMGLNTLLTFGGAFSNHIAATAFAAKLYGFRCIGIIRGEAPHPLNKTLLQAIENGMQLHFISREQYRRKEQPEFLESLNARFGDFYHIPEGGSNRLAVKGCGELMNELNALKSNQAAG